MINFISGGHTGDLIHELYVVKNICTSLNDKANLYITDSSSQLFGCENFSFDLNKIFNDTKDLINYQDYINEYNILPNNFDEKFVNLSKWRGLRTTYGFTNWTKLLCDFYKLRPSPNYRWIDIENIDTNTLGKILIHHSGRRCNHNFDWNILSNTKKDVLFITSNIEEYKDFQAKHNSKAKLYLLETVSEIFTAINSCDLFIGNQSMPFAIACSLDKKRICELHYLSAEFYINENLYSNNISWVLDNRFKFNSNNIELKV